MFGKKKEAKASTIKVTFYEGARDGTDTQMFSRSAIPLEHLPETFEVATQLHIDESDWEVVEAVPSHRDQFAKTGRLSLYLIRIESADAGAIRVSQLDIAEQYTERPALERKTWVRTMPMNAHVGPEELPGLPPADADADEVYAAAVKLSAFREAARVDSDGVYCPVCHIANVDRGRFNEPCPQCGRALLLFGWT